MATINVSTTGNDTTGTGAVGAPYATGAKAAAVAVNGDTIIFGVGSFAGGFIFAQTDLTVTGQVDSNGEPTTIITGGATGIRFGAPTLRCRITNFEITGQTAVGLDVQSSAKGVSNDFIGENLHVHHVIGTLTNQYGIRVSYGNPTLLNVHVHHLGPSNETWGIWLNSTHSALVDGYEIYMVRKEGIRGYLDRDSRICNGRSYCNWGGLHDSESLSSLHYNNYLYDNVYAINPKHSNTTDSAGGYTAWSEPFNTLPWSRWYHNTCWRNFEAGLTSYGGTGGTANEIDFRNNISGGAGGAHFYESSLDPQGLVDPTKKTRTGRFIMDYNMMTTDTPVPYWTLRGGFSFFTASNSKSLTQIQTEANWLWQTHPVVGDPLFFDPAAGNFDYPNTSPAYNSGQNDPTFPLGAQMGARGVRVPRKRWTRKPLSLVDAATNLNTAGRVFDPYEGTVHTTLSANGWVIGDAGAQVTFNHLRVHIYTHGALQNPKLFTFETADNATGPWTMVLNSQHFDNLGADHKYELATTTARYIRYTVVSNWETTKTVTYLNNIEIGMLEASGALPIDPPPNPDPIVTVLPGAYWGRRINVA